MAVALTQHWKVICSRDRNVCLVVENLDLLDLDGNPKSGIAISLGWWKVRSCGSELVVPVSRLLLPFPIAGSGSGHGATRTSGNNLIRT